MVCLPGFIETALNRAQQLLLKTIVLTKTRLLSRKIAPSTFEEKAEAYEHVLHVIQVAVDYYKKKILILQYRCRK